MSLKSRIKNGVDTITLRNKLDDVNATGNIHVIKKVAEEEGWTLEYAQEVCLSEPGDDLYNPKYALSYKVGTADVILLLQTKGGEKKFVNSLPEEERRIFIEEDIGNHTRAEFKAELKRQLGGRK